MKTAYKLFRKKTDGSLTPLFINKKQILNFDQWMDAEVHPTKGFAFRPGWHCAPRPEAPHLSTKGRVWCEVLIEDFKEIIRPKIQGGSWFLANRMKIIKELN